MTCCHLKKITRTAVSGEYARVVNQSNNGSRISFNQQPPALSMNATSPDLVSCGLPVESFPSQTVSPPPAMP